MGKPATVHLGPLTLDVSLGGLLVPSKSAKRKRREGLLQAVLGDVDFVRDVLKLIG